MAAVMCYLATESLLFKSSLLKPCQMLGVPVAFPKPLQLQECATQQLICLKVLIFHFRRTA